MRRVAGTRRRLSAALATIALLFGTSVGRADDSAKSKADALLGSATHSVQNFLTNPQWQAVRNLLGGARAIFIVPHDIQGGFLLTASGGDGVLLRRHGTLWSDPVFLHIGSMGVGFEAGAENQSLAMVVMTDSGVDRLIDGAVRMGGSGGFALASLGAGGSAGGSVASGLQLLTVSTNQGLFAGGGLEGTTVSVKDAYNQASYGAGYDLAGILRENGGKLAAAAQLRSSLTRAVDEAWGR